MKIKTIIASILLIASGSLAALACDCGKATAADEEQQQSACNCKAQCFCTKASDNGSEIPGTDNGSEAADTDEPVEEN